MAPLPIVIFAVVFGISSLSEAGPFLSEVDPIIADMVGEKPVRSVHADSEGRLWIGSQTGLEIFMGKKRWRAPGRSGYSTKPPWNADIVSIDEDENGNVFVLTVSSGLYGFDIADSTLNPIRISLIEGASALAIRKGGEVWVAHGSSIQLLSLNPGTLHVVEDRELRLTGKVTTDFAFDQQGQGCFGLARVIRCQDGRDSWEDLASIRVLNGSTPLSIALDARDRIFVGLSNGELFFS